MSTVAGGERGEERSLLRAAHLTALSSSAGASGAASDRESFGSSEEEAVTAAVTQAERRGGGGRGGSRRDGQLSVDGILDASSSNKRATRTMMLVLAMGNAADAVEILSAGFVLDNVKTNSGGDLSSFQKELLTSAIFAGMLVGGVLCGFLADRVGRRPCLLYSLLLNAIAGLASAVAPNLTTLIVLRVVAGIGVGGSVPSVFTIGAEVFPAAHRGSLLSVIASFWMVGAIYAAGVAWVLLGDDVNGNRMMPGVSWRVYIALAALPAFVTFLLTIKLVPESPRFLLLQGKREEAAAVLTRVTGSYLAPGSLHASRPEDVAAARLSLWDTLRYLFSPGLKSTSTALFIIWFTLSFGSYGIATWIAVLFDDLGIGNVYANTFLFSLANLPGNLVSILYMENIGRRRLLAASMTLAAGSALGFAFNPDSSALVVIMACLFNAFSVAGWNALDCLSAESWPTAVRTGAMGTLAALGRLGSISAQVVNGSLESNIPLLLFVTASCMLVGGLSSMLLRETTGKHMDEDDIDTYFDDEDNPAFAPQTQGERSAASNARAQDGTGAGVGTGAGPASGSPRYYVQRAKS